MKKIWGSVLLLIIIAFFISQIRTVTYVPFKNKMSPINEFNAQHVVALKDHYFKLKFKFPKIKMIHNIDQLANEDVILMPWNTKNPNLQYLPINGHSFFDTKEGAIQFKTLSKKSDGYDDFLLNKTELTAGGTVVLARGVHKVIQSHNDIDYPWKDTRHLFTTSSINIVNFKSPLISDFKYPKSSWVLIGKSEYATAMANANIHLVSLAGNHMGDAKMNGLLETIQTLKKLNIETIGAGQTMSTAYACKKITRKNSTFGFLGFNNVPGSIGKPTEKTPGIAWLDNNALSAIKNCSKKVNILVVMVNWGVEYTHFPREKERRWAKKMIEAGADLILGDQAHWVQTHERIHAKHVSYGLGNYIFDQHWSENTTEGIIQRFIFYNDEMVAIDTTPIKLFKNGQVKVIKKNSPRYSHVLNAYNGIPALK
jgi:poly-gamma-glutamate synthesis protein (capsule biosynthesis protein)